MNPLHELMIKLGLLKLQEKPKKNSKKGGKK